MTSDFPIRSLLTKGAPDTIHLAVALIHGLRWPSQLDATGAAEIIATECAAIQERLHGSGQNSDDGTKRMTSSQG